MTESAKQERRAYHNAWRKRNPDKVREYNRKSWERNKDRIKAQREAYWERRAAAAAKGGDV